MPKFNPSKKAQDSPLTNGERADNGQECLSHVFDYAENDATTALEDMLANLLHFCDREDIDFDAAVSTAKMHWQSER